MSNRPNCIVTCNGHEIYAYSYPGYPESPPPHLLARVHFELGLGEFGDHQWSHVVKMIREDYWSLRVECQREDQPVPRALLQAMADYIHEHFEQGVYEFVEDNS